MPWPHVHKKKKRKKSETCNRVRKSFCERVRIINIHHHHHHLEMATISSSLPTNSKTIFSVSARPHFLVPSSSSSLPFISTAIVIHFHNHSRVNKLHLRQRFSSVTKLFVLPLATTTEWYMFLYVLVPKQTCFVLVIVISSFVLYVYYGLGFKKIFHHPLLQLHLHLLYSMELPGFFLIFFFTLQMKLMFWTNSLFILVAQDCISPTNVPTHSAYGSHVTLRLVLLWKKMCLHQCWYRHLWYDGISNKISIFWMQGLQEKIQLVPIDLQDRPSWYKDKLYPPNKVHTIFILLSYIFVLKSQILLHSKKCFF